MRLHGLIGRRMHCFIVIGWLGMWVVISHRPLPKNHWYRLDLSDY